MSSSDLRDSDRSSEALSLVPLVPPPPPLPQTYLCTSMLTHLLQNKSPGAPVQKGDLVQMIEGVCHQYWRALSSEQPAIFVSLYHHCEPVLQNGPTCGLVALMMCLKLIKPEIDLTLESVLDQAQSLGYTKFGEMFSVGNMCELIRREFRVKAEVKRDLSRSMLEVVRHVCRGLPVLVPYDADSNYEPCLKEGTRAHWATLCGFCIVTNGTVNSLSIELNSLKVSSLDQEHTLLQLAPENSAEKTLAFLKRFLTMDRLYVYARQGKTRRVQLWKFGQLCESNRNLRKVSPKIITDPERVHMIYPKDGQLDQSLSNQFILVSR